jgi:hypothetical protein
MIRFLIPVTRAAGGLMGALVAVCLVGICWVVALAPVMLVRQTPAEAQGYFMPAKEFNAIAARMGCYPESADGELLGTALTRVAECLAGKFAAVEGRLKALEGKAAKRP